eukprot:CAMPEP_0181299002 /NCGR_PEP_ID=MMETSP1101-20121128/6097_1 /TAXON_ID=46948 /ORGANISM="Rhodomonas abbreviata, Strain Caron Lab Isolate" /LENGTH=573 /DNA_ID=CAMNT_0023404089 /DNA_START=166 /DNA_END=1884 /DNA_ORIENTATION=-
MFERLEPTKAAIRNASALTATEGAEWLHSELNKIGWTFEGTKDKESETEQEDCIALAFRMVLEELVVANNKDGKQAFKDARVVCLLDVSMHAAMSAWVPRQLPLMAMHELFEGQTARQCDEAFAYMEQRVEQMRKLVGTGEGTARYSQAALLRCCNALVQRLSKSCDLLLCGRVLMFLAHVLPLSERSGVNLKGEFNKANVTEFEESLDPSEADRLESEGGDEREFKLKSTDEKLDGQMEVSFFLYKTFWGLQKFLHDPATLLSEKGVGNLEALSSGLNVVLENFATYTLSDVEGMAGHSADREFFFPGFLTSTKLVSLELQDPTFRRHVMVQYLIVIHYLLDHSVHPPKAQELTKKHKEDLVKHQERIYRLLEGVPPRGGHFVATLRRVMERENNWGAWKKNKCPDFSREFAADVEGPELKVGDKRKEIEGATAMWKRRFLTSKVKDAFIPETCATGSILEMCAPKARKGQKGTEDLAEQIQTRFAIVREEADPENYIESEYRKNSVPCWRWVTMRMLALYDINLFTYATAENKFMEGVVSYLDGKHKESAKNGPSADDSKDGQEEGGGGGG